MLPICKWIADFAYIGTTEVWLSSSLKNERTARSTSGEGTFHSIKDAPNSRFVTVRKVIYAEGIRGIG